MNPENIALALPKSQDFLYHHFILHYTIHCFLSLIAFHSHLLLHIPASSCPGTGHCPVPTGVAAAVGAEAAGPTGRAAAVQLVEARATEGRAVAQLTGAGAWDSKNKHDKGFFHVFSSGLVELAPNKRCGCQTHSPA